MYFEEIVKRLSPVLKKITHGLNGHYTFFNDDDLYQEALLHLWTDFENGKLNDKTDSYILQGCFFYLKNYIRKVKDSVSFIPMDTFINDEEMSLFPDDFEKSIDNLSDKILCEKIQDLKFTEREKEVMTLLSGGLTLREIGEKLGISHVMVIKIKANIKKKAAIILN